VHGAVVGRERVHWPSKVGGVCLEQLHPVAPQCFLTKPGANEDRAVLCYPFDSFSILGALGLAKLVGEIRYISLAAY
jgi:hypothetical protein